MINWKQYDKKISISRNAVNKKEWELLEKSIEMGRQFYECLGHELFYPLFNGYRRYRRGKNRCHRCGLKIYGSTLDTD